MIKESLAARWATLSNKKLRSPLVLSLSTVSAIAPGDGGNIRATESIKIMQKRYTVATIALLVFLAYAYSHGVRRIAYIDAGISYCSYALLWANKTCVQPVKAWREERVMAAHLYDLLVHARQEKDQLEGRIVALEGQLQFVRDTHELREFAQRYSETSGTLAQVLAHIVSHEEHYFLLDAGSNKGVEVDMVGVYKNCLLGRVTEVYPLYSKLTLITDRSCKVAAFCVHAGTQGIHEGIQSLHCSRLSFVNRLESLEIGDMVLSSGEGLVFPRGYGLGTVKEFVPHELYYDVALEPLVDLSHVLYCSVVKKGAHQES